MRKLPDEHARFQNARQTKKAEALKVADACRRHARYRFTRTEIRHSRLGSSVQNLPKLFNDGKTIVR
jgi:hypothetical protein